VGFDELELPELLEPPLELLLETPELPDPLELLVLELAPLLDVLEVLELDPPPVVLDVPPATSIVARAG